MLRRTAAAVFSMLVLAPSAQGQTSETVQVNLVEIAVNVVDRGGEPIRGLRPENFEVYDEGQRRRITHFEEIDLAKLSTDPDEVVSPAARRNFLLVFDLSHTSPKALLRARQAASDFVEESLLRRDLVSVATFSVENGFRILTAFTTDREMVGYAIRTLGHPQFYETRDPLLLASNISPTLLHGGVNPEDADSAFAVALREYEKMLNNAVQTATSEHARGRIERQLVSFSEMARMLDRIRGRKQVVLLSEGFDASLIQGQDHASISSEDRELDFLAQARGEIWKVNNDQRFGSVTALRSITDMTEVFRRSDVVLHSIDIQGVPAATDARTGSQRSASESHFLMAEATGGEVFKHSNDIGQSFAKLLRQQEVVYILGFQTRPSGTPGKFHDLAVKVKIVGHRGLRVSHRKGYYEPRLQMSVVEQQLSATDILMNDIPFEEVGIDILAAPFPLDDNRSQVPVIAEISGKDLIGGVEGNVLNAELFIYAFDEENRVRDFLFQTLSIDLARIRGSLRESGIKYYGTLVLPRGEYTIKSLVRVMESGRNGFERLRLNVPARTEKTLLPPMLFEAPGKWIMYKGAKTAEGQVDYPFMLVDESFIPSARPVLFDGQSYKLALFTRNMAPEEIEIVARVEGADGRHTNPSLKLVGRTSAVEDGTIKLLLDFTPVGYGPGEYALHLTARERGGDRFREVSLPFRVAPGDR